MDWQGWVTGVVVVGMVGALASGRFGTDAVVLGALLVLVLIGAVGVEEALIGFSSPGVITIGMLYVLATGLSQTGAMTTISRLVMGQPGGERSAQARLALPVAVMSAFVNNTPIVAMFLPIVTGISRRTGIPGSRLFLPLSYAAILGGVCTLIGTSTNIVVKMLIDEHNEDVINGTLDGYVVDSMGMFTITWVGLPVALFGMAYLLIAGRRLLPAREEVVAKDQKEAREYMTAMKVNPGSVIEGRTVEQAGLRHLPGLYLARIERNGGPVLAVSPTEELRGGDTLVFIGDIESVVDLQKIKGLEPTGGPEGYRPNMKLIEVVISTGSPLVGVSVREGAFRTRYGAVIIAVHRHGQRLEGKIGDIVLRGGDTLLIEARGDFARRFSDSKDFYLVSEREGIAAPRHERSWISLVILGVVVTLLATQWVDTVVAAMIGALAMVGTRCCKASEARGGVDWRVLIVIAGAFGIGRAMEQTGVATHVAGAILALTEGGPPILLLGLVYVITIAFTACINNNAAAVLMFPIVLEIAGERGLDFMPFAVVLVIAASCEFMTPIGYQTNLMVMGPGGYRWGDYLRFGGPLTGLCAVVCVSVCAFWYGTDLRDSDATAEPIPAMGVDAERAGEAFGLSENG